MRKILISVAVLIVTLAVGCSREPPHVGEWETEIHAGPRSVTWGGSYIFLESGTIKFAQMNLGKPKSVETGNYKIDASKDPIQIDIAWENGKSEVGILRFIGEEKRLMEIELTTPGSKERPASFGRDTMLLTKKAKK